jgi:hypothetical protein
VPAIELVTQHALSSATADTPAPYDDRVALYRAGIRLYLRLVALQLAQKIGRAIERSASLSAYHDPASIAAGLEHIAAMCSKGPTDLSQPAHSPREHPPLPLCGGGTRGGGAPPGQLIQEAVLNDSVLLQTMSDAALQATDSLQSPGTTLSLAYETLLAYAPTSNHQFSLRASAEHVKHHGSFYTKRPLARAVVEGTLFSIRERLVRQSSSLRVLDPAMGTGVFLLQAVHALVRAGAGTAAEMAESCVYGFDVDPLAVEVAVLSLWLETGARLERLSQNLRQHDPLRITSSQTDDRFDLVVGNPPWGAVYSPAERTSLQARWPLSSSGSFDSFKLFVEFAAERSNGAIGMVLPRAVLSQTTHASVRELLLQRFAPYEVRILEASEFPRAVAPACSLIFGPRPGPATIAYCLGGTRSPAPHPAGTIPARFWTRDRFPLRNAELLDVLDELCRDHPRLGELSHLYRLRDAGINYNRATIARRILYERDTAEHPQDVPRYRGRNFSRYGVVQQGGWLRHDAHLRLEPGEQLYLSHETYRRPEKVVFRQTADRITATLDRTCMAMGRSVISVVAEADAPLLPLLACLNSELFTCLYRALAEEEGRVLPQVKVKTMSLLPLPRACLDGPGNPAWIRLGEMARTRLERQDDGATLDREIDHTVCALFGISAGEGAEIKTRMSPQIPEY